MTQREIQSLLPFYANGTLSKDESLAVDQSLAADATLRHELDALRAIRNDLQNTPFEQSPGEFGFARLTRALAAETQEAPQQTSKTNNIFQYGMVACLFAALGVFIGTSNQPVGLDSPALYEAASGAEGDVLRIHFTETATAASISELLLSLNLEIVAGPSALGFYDVAPFSGPLDEETQNALASNLDIIETVE